MTHRILIALGLMFLAHSALAVSMGEIDAKSALGQPLRAEIPLLDAQEWSPEQLKVKLSGVKESSAREVKLAIVKSGDTHVIRLTTQQSVNEPYVGFTLSLSWPQGSIQRDYQLLLDPLGR